jgi:HAD superfamily hydrolase (TIGR01549 family)
LNTSMIKGVFFDLYGTLLVFSDFDAAHAGWLDSFKKFIGDTYKLESSVIEEACNAILDAPPKKDATSGLTTYETSIRDEFCRKGISLSIEEIHSIADHSLVEWQKYVKLADDALSVLSHLKKTKTIALITNFDHSTHVRRVLSEAGLADLFHSIIISDVLEIKKPESAIFDAALKDTGLKNNEVVYVGDNINDDILGSHNAGLTPILISRKAKSNYSKDHARPVINNAEVASISSLSQLMDMFE